MHHEIIDNTYYLYSESNELLLKIELLDNEHNQVRVALEDNIYEGPVKFLLV